MSGTGFQSQVPREGSRPRAKLAASALDLSSLVLVHTGIGGYIRHVFHGDAIIRSSVILSQTRNSAGSESDQPKGLLSLLQQPDQYTPPASRLILSPAVFPAISPVNFQNLGCFGACVREPGLVRPMQCSASQSTVPGVSNCQFPLV